MKRASLGRAGWCFSWTKSTFLFSFLLSLIIFLHLRFRKFSLLLECLIALKGINSLGRKLALTCLFNVNSMLGDIADSSSFAMVTLVRRSFWKSVRSLDIYNITFLVDSPVYSQRNNSKFSRRPRERVVGTPFPLCWLFGKLLKDGNSEKNWN